MKPVTRRQSDSQLVPVKVTESTGVKPREADFAMQSNIIHMWGLIMEVKLERISQ